MDNYRLKVKIGDYEFEAEGSSDVVQSQFQAFRDMIATAPTRASTKGAEPPRTNPSPTEPTTRTDLTSVDSSLSRIMKAEDRIVSLTVRPEEPDEAVLLLLYGQRVLRNNEAPTGSEIVDGIEATGGVDIGRSDRMFERIARNGDVVHTGERRGKRYRLTNQGINHARQVAADLLALVA